MLKIRNLRKAYGEYHALNGLDMEIADGALYGFVGPNGAGKTTAIRIMTGLLRADSGRSRRSLWPQSENRLCAGFLWGI